MEAAEVFFFYHFQKVNVGLWTERIELNGWIEVWTISVQQDSQGAPVQTFQNTHSDQFELDLREHLTSWKQSSSCCSPVGVGDFWEFPAFLPVPERWSSCLRKHGSLAHSNLCVPELPGTETSGKSLDPHRLLPTTRSRCDFVISGRTIN